MNKLFSQAIATVAILAGAAITTPAAAQDFWSAQPTNPSYVTASTASTTWTGASNLDVARTVVSGQGRNQLRSIDRAGAWNLGTMLVGGMVTRANMSHQASLEAPLIALRGDQEVRAIRAKGDEQRQTNDNQTDNQIRWGQFQRGTTATATQGSGEITLDPSRCRQNSNGTVTCQR